MSGRAALRLSSGPVAGAASRLVCFSFAGGGVMPFRQWSRVLDDRTELWGVCYPGREAAFGTPAPNDWQELVAWCVEATRGSIRPPYVLFGHSMGALMAYEVARTLLRESCDVQQVIVSGHRAPQRRPGHSAALAAASDAVLLGWMTDLGGAPPQALSHPDLRRLALDLLRGDLRAYSTYRHRPEPLLDCDLHVVRGEDEPWEAADLLGWEEATLGRTTSQVLPGGHFYTPHTWTHLPDRFGSRAEGAGR